MRLYYLRMVLGLEAKIYEWLSIAYKRTTDEFETQYERRASFTSVGWWYSQEERFQQEKGWTLLMDKCLVRSLRYTLHYYSIMSFNHSQNMHKLLLNIIFQSKIESKIYRSPILLNKYTLS